MDKEPGWRTDSPAEQFEGRAWAEKVARGQMAALARTLDLLAAEPEIDSFVGQVLTALTEQLGAQSGTFWLYDSAESSAVLRLDYHNRLPTSAGGIVEDQPSGPAVPVKSATHGGPARSSAMQFYGDIGSSPLDDLYREELLSKGARSLLVVPLVSGNDLIGSFSLLRDTPDEYMPEELELARALAQQAVLAIQLTRLSEHRRQAAVLEERNRIAREIHDTLAQEFAGILLQLRVAQRIAAKSPEEAWSLIEHVSSLAQKGLSEARRSVWDLQPDSIEYRDLVGAIQKAVEKLPRSVAPRVSLLVHGTPRPMIPATGMDLFRIAQEALTNAVRHGNPVSITVDLLFEQHRVQLSVRDDGVGFDLGSHSDTGGFGLLGMAQRAERLGGKLTVSTSLGRGTEVSVWAPTPPPPSEIEDTGPEHDSDRSERE